MKSSAVSVLLSLALVASPALGSHDIVKLFENPHARQAKVDHLGRRDVSRNGMGYPDPGTTVPAKFPDAWRDRYNQVKASGKIPNIPKATVKEDGGVTTYPSGTSDSEVCSWTRTQCFPAGCLSTWPQKMGLLAMDDGPVSEVISGYKSYVEQNNLIFTHFLIGSQILWDTPALLALNSMNPPQHLASHSFTHTMMTNHTDLEIVADLGWSMQLIYDYTGKVPLYFRPPMGDTDNRVFAIAKYVFGLQTVMFDFDTNDWCIQPGNKIYQGGGCEKVTLTSYRDEFKSYVSSGRGVVPLFHELRTTSFPVMKGIVEELKAAGYKYGPAPLAQSLPWYANAYGQNDKPTAPKDILPTREPFDIKDFGATSNGVDLKTWNAKGLASGAGATSTGGSGELSSRCLKILLQRLSRRSCGPLFPSTTRALLAQIHEQSDSD